MKGINLYPFFITFELMDKTELYRLLYSADKKNELWNEAFKMYKEVFPKSDIEVECRSCRAKVLNWLRRG